MWNNNFFITLFIGLILLPTKGSSHQTNSSILKLTPSNKSVNILHHAEIYIDPSKELNLRQVISKDEFSSSNERKSITTNIDSHYWMKFHVFNPNSESLQHFIPITSGASLFEVYIERDKKIQLLGDYGYRSNNQDKEFFHHPAFEYLFQKNEAVTFYIKIKFARVTQLRIDMGTKAESQKLIATEWGLVWLYTGFIFSLILYNLFLYFRLRDIAYLHYVLFAAAMIINTSAIKGVIDLFGFHTEDFYWIEHTPQLFICITITAFLFCQSFLDLKQRSPKLNKIFNMLCGIGIIGILGCFSYDNPIFWNQFSDKYTTTAMLLVFATSIYIYKKGVSEAAYYISAWGVFFAAVIVWKLGQVNVLEENYIIMNLPPIGNMLEMSLMSLALAQRIKKMQDQQLESSVKIHQGEQNKKLLRVVCHDIANPMTVAENFTGLLEFKINDPANKRYILKIQKALEMMKEILENVRKIEGADSGKTQLELKAVSINQVVKDLEFLFGDKLQSKKVVLNLNIPKEKNLHILADETAFTHDILSNLISNAIKFSPEGGQINLKVEELSQKKIEISVEDHGIGIPIDIQEKIFDPYANTSRNGTLGEKGTGFGLPLVKSYIELFHGDISIKSTCANESINNSGSIFSLTLIKAKAPATKKEDQQVA